MAIKLQVVKDDLLKGLQRVQNIICPRSTLPILSNALFSAEKNAIALTSTDLEVGVKTTVPATVAKAGATTVPCRKFFSIVRELPSPDIEIEVDEKDSILVRSGAAFFKILGLPEAEFPRFPSISGGVSFSLDIKLLLSLLRRTSFAASTDEARYVLNGVFFQVKGDKVTAVATDGRRLALSEVEAQTSASKEASFILPSKAVAEVVRLSDQDGNASATFTDSQIIFSVGSSVVASKLIEGEFPNFRQVIPSESKERMKLERELFLSALHRVSLLSTERPCPVRLSFSKNQLAISATDPEVGEAKETIPVSFKGKEMTIGFNPHFLMDPLKVLDADEVIFELTDDISPGVLKVEGESFLYVLMPMRLN